LTQKDLATILGRPVQVVSEIVSGIKQITPQTALELGAALDTGPELWLNLETNYRLSMARQKASGDAISKRARMYAIAPVAELIRRGWVQGGNDLEAGLCQFLNVASVWDVPVAPARLRASLDRGPDMRNVTAWLRRVEQLGTSTSSVAFDPEVLRSHLPDIASMSVDPEAVASIPTVLAQDGVALVIVPHLQKTYLDGGAMWVNGRPVVALTLRYDRLDNFYFTLMHELAHVVLGHSGFMAEDLEDTGDRDPDERAADQLAQDSLVDPDSYAAMTRAGADIDAIEVAATKIHRHPSILIGRLRHDHLLGYGKASERTVKIRHHLAAAVDQPSRL
jgi:HTH-type transcriptional regulator/antitoxin HigA